jgi:hypothetical protein
VDGLGQRLSRPGNEQLDQVRQWCADSYGKYDIRQKTDPAGPSKGDDKERRVRRGGYWDSSGSGCPVTKKR